MKRFSLKKSALISAAFLAITPAMAMASGTGQGYISGTNPTVLKVKSNGQAYTQLDLIGNFSIQGKLEVTHGNVGRVKSWWAQPKIIHGYGIPTPIPGMAAYQKSKSYSVGHRPKNINETIVFSLPGSMIQTSAVAMCNWQADTLRGQGKSNQQIFGQNRFVSFILTMQAGVYSTGYGGIGLMDLEADVPYVFKVQCSKWKGAQGPSASNDVKAPIQVSKATMQLKEVVTLGGTCKVDTTTAIVASEANATIKYRFVHSSGKKSKVFSVKTRGNKIAVVHHQWNIPNGPRVERGRLWIEGVSPGFKSNKARYSMRCKPKGAGGFAPNPKKPKVRIPLGGLSIESN